MLWKILAILLVLWSIVCRWKRRKIIALSKQLSLNKLALPFIGHSYLFLGSGEDRMTRINKVGQEAISKGGLTSYWQGSRLYVFVAEPVAAEVVLKTCLEKDDMTKLFRKLIGNGSIFATVSAWRTRRKVLAPSFTPKNLNNFVEVFARHSNIMSGQLKSGGNGPFSIWKYLATYTMDSVCETALGVQVNAQLQPEQPFLKAFENCCRIDAERIFRPWLYNEYVYKFFCTDSFELHTRSKEFIWNFINEVISFKRKALSEDSSTLKSVKSSSQTNRNNLKTFLELLIESSEGKNEGKIYNDAELREETLVIVLAGTDTTAVGTAFATIMLAKNRDVQDKVYQELQEIFGDSDRPVTSEDLPRLKYLDAVIRETLRLYPPAPLILRQVQKDITLPSGVTLVEGCGIVVSIWSIHRNPDYWGDDAEQFRPERFIDTPLKHPAAFIPFSYGPRNCLGYQYAMSSMKTALATLLRQYVVKLPTGKYTGKEIRVKFDLMMKDVDDFIVELDLRK